MGGRTTPALLIPLLAGRRRRRSRSVLAALLVLAFAGVSACEAVGEPPVATPASVHADEPLTLTLTPTLTPTPAPTTDLDEAAAAPAPVLGDLPRAPVVGEPPPAPVVGEPQPTKVSAAAGSEPDAPPLAIRWQTYHFAEADMDLEIADAPHSTHAWPQGGVFSQRIAGAREADAIKLLIRAGEGESLESLQGEHDKHGAKASRITRGTTCGRPSRHLEIARPEQVIECIEFADGTPSRPGFVPAMTVVAESFRYGELDVVASWEVATAARERHRGEERRFFAGLRCPATD